ncbi:hypothetical protein ScPMuIL_009178 [Solemya velum]
MSDNEADQLGEEEAPEGEELPDDGGEEEQVEDEEEKMQENEGEQQEEEEKIPEVPLTEDIITECLSLLCKTGDGLSHAFVRMDVHERELTNISMLKSYIHLRYIDVSKNNLKDISSLSSLTHLLTLRADYNMLTSARLEEMPFLQVASFNFNKITSTEGVNHPMLEHLSLNNNEIAQVTGLNANKLSRLHTLELRGNRLETTDGIYLPNLKNLFLAANTIKKIEGFSRMQTLTTLHLRENQLENLDGFSEDMKMLQYINFRSNNISSTKEIGKLKVLPMLRAVAFSENPVTEEDDYRLEVLIALRKIERLDKDEYTEEERNESEDIYEQRLQEMLAAKNEEMLGSDTEDVNLED